MIVVASDNPVVVDEISTLLRQKGDLFTVAADETLALSAIRADRATLLIADTGASVFDGFVLCRTIRGDPALSNLPVLCIVEPTDLGVILSVLDCTADAFLSRPFDLGSLSAAIGDLQERQAGGTGAGAVRTRFRINNEGRDYSVVADRRQLLEFLIAAFEAAVRIRGDQARMRSGFQDEIRGISERLGTLTAERDATVTNLHEELEERSRTAAKLNAALQAKEQAEVLVKTQKENVAQELKELGAVLETTRRSDEEKDRKIAALASDLAAAAEEKARAGQEHAENVSALESRIKETASDLDSSRSTAAGLRVKTAELERMLAAVQEEHGREKEKVRSLTGELEKAVRGQDTLQQKCRQLEDSLRQVSDAAQAKEQEIRSALDNLNSEIHAVREALEQNLRQLERELAAKNELKNLVESITKERDALAQAGNRTDARFGEMESQLAAERELRARVQAECDAITAERERTQDVLGTTYRELAEVKEKEAGSRQFLNSASRDIGVLNTALEQEREKKKAAEDRVHAAEKESAEKDRRIIAISAELDALRTTPSERKAAPPVVEEKETLQAPDKPKNAPVQPAPPRADSAEYSPAIVQLLPDESPRIVADVLGASKPAADSLLPPPPSYQMTLPAPAAAPVSLPGPDSAEKAALLEPGADVAVQGGSQEYPAQPPCPALEDIDAPQQPTPRMTAGDRVISRDRWLDITKWAHHTKAVTEEQRRDLIANLMRLSKLVQKDRHLTNRQEQEIRALVARVQSLGYRFV